MSKSTIWNVLGEQFVVSDGGSLTVGNRGFSVAIKRSGSWIPVSEDLGTIVLLSMFEKREPRMFDEAKHRTPVIVQHCIGKVTKRFGGSREAVSKAYAICIAAMQKNGFIVPGTMELTSKGKTREKEHIQEPDAGAKKAGFEAALAKGVK